MSDQCSVCLARDIDESSPISIGLALGLHRPAGSPSGKPLFFLRRGKIAFSGFGERYMGIIPCFCYFFCPFPQNRWMSFFLAFSMENDPTFTKTRKKITFTKTRKYLYTSAATFLFLFFFLSRLAPELFFFLDFFQVYRAPGKTTARAG